MANIVAAIIFIFISFTLGMSIAFNLIAKISNESLLFTSKKKAFAVYGTASIFATLFTIVSYIAVCTIQVLT